MEKVREPHPLCPPTFSEEKKRTTDISHLDGFTYFWYGDWGLPGHAEGWRILTTPNSTWIPFPYILHRDVYLRQDGFLGREDPALSPQLYIESLPHLACISLASSEGSDSRFFRENVDAVFIDPPTSFPRGCELSAVAKSRCQSVWDRLKLEYKTFTTRQGKDRHDRLNVTTSQFGVGFESLSRFRGLYLELKFRFALLCRLYLEIEAYYRHHELSVSHEFSMDARRVDSSLVGTITTDETVCYRFHRMGVPVWLNRPLAVNSGLSCRLITEKIPLNPEFQKTSSGGVDIVVARVPNVRPIFEGPQGDPSYLLRISEWVRDCFRTNLGEDHPLRPFFASYQRKPRQPRADAAGTTKKRKTGSLDDGETSKKAKKGKRRTTEGACVSRCTSLSLSNGTLIHRHRTESSKMVEGGEREGSSSTLSSIRRPNRC